MLNTFRRLGVFGNLGYLFLQVAVLACLFLSACQKTNGTAEESSIASKAGGTNGGTGDAFGGSDQPSEELDQIRFNRLSVQWQSVAQIPNGVSICNFQQLCANETHPLCNAFPSLSSAEMQTCNDTIRAIAPAAIAAVASSTIELAATTDPITVDGTRVTARTELKGDGKIWVDVKRAMELGMSKDQVAVLLTHEFLHKTLINQTYLDDGVPVGAFTTKGAERLFTAIGYALTLRRALNKDIQAGGYPAMGIFTGGLRMLSTASIIPAISSNADMDTDVNFTWTFVIQITSSQSDTETDRNILFIKGDDGSVFPYYCEYVNQTAWWNNEGKIECGLRDEGSVGRFGVMSDVKVNDGRPHFIAFRRVGNVLLLTVDSVSTFRVAAFDFKPTANSAPLQVGHRQSKNRFRGKLGFLHLWKRNFNGTQLSALRTLLGSFLPGLL